MSARRLKNILSDPRGRIGQLQERSDQLARLNRRLYEILPPPLHEHVRLVAVSEERVVLRADSPAWLTRLRFQLPQVRRLLREILGLQARRVEIGVMRRLYTPQRVERHALAISPQGRRTLEQAADASDDEALASALRRLASRGCR
jgi:hypothetical protein